MTQRIGHQVTALVLLTWASAVGFLELLVRYRYLAGASSDHLMWTFWIPLYFGGFALISTPAIQDPKPEQAPVEHQPETPKVE